jgi:hypothetical protein
MMEGASFIQQELTKVVMEEALRKRTRQLCINVIGAGRDVVSELWDFDEPV